MEALELVQRQLEAYNRHDLDAFAACFSQEVRMVQLPSGQALVVGQAELRARYQSRFGADSVIQAEVVHRIQLGSRVIDHESVTGLSEQPVEVVVIYEASDGLINWVGFVSA